MSKNKKTNLGMANINLLFNQNNTFVSMSDKLGNILEWSSAGRQGFKSSTKSTPVAGQMVIEKFFSSIQHYKVNIFHITIKGFNPARDHVLKGIQSAGVNIGSITDVTGIPHNGCRPPKKRRI